MTQNPMPQNPAPQNPAPQHPAPQNPAPQNPAPHGQMPRPQSVPQPVAMPPRQHNPAQGQMPSPQPMPRPQGVPQQSPQSEGPPQPQMAPPLTAPQPPHQQPQPGQMPQGQSAQNQMPLGQDIDNRMPPPAAIGMPQENQEEDFAREGGEKALPQISIHAFCDRQESASVINNTTRDWRMKRVNMKIYMGGLSSAIDFYHKENTPNLILVETGMHGPELFAQLEQLASVCDEGTKVVIIGAANDIRLYRQLMEKGVSEYIVPPLMPLNLIRSLSDLYADPDAPFIGRVAAFFGAKGGVGSSTLAHNMAWCLAERLGQETSLVDLDSSFGTTGLDFAYDNSQGLEEALSQPDRLDETLLDRIMIRHTPKLSILPAASSLNSKPVLDSEAYEAVVNGVRSISPLTILDMPHYWADWTSGVLSSVDDVVITATPDLANLRNTKNLVDFLRSQRPNDEDPILILNKAGMSKSAEIPVKEFATAVGLEPSLVISFDPESFFEAANEGKMLDQVKAADRTVSGLSYVANRLKTGRFDMAAQNQGGKRKIKMPKKDGVKQGDTQKGKSIFSFLKKGK